MFFVCRKRGSLGIATDLVTAANFDNFHVMNPDLEILGVYKELEAAKKHFLSDSVFTKVTDYGRRK